MAMEINYCDQCGIKIAATEFSSGIPVRDGDKTFCQKCALKAGLEIPEAPPVARRKTPLQSRIVERPQPARESDTGVSMRTQAQRSSQKMMVYLIGACIFGLAITIYLLNLKVETSVAASSSMQRRTIVKPELRKELRENAQEGMQEVKALNAWTQAEQTFSESKWQDARAQFEAFKKDFSTTAFFGRQSGLLTARLAAINAALDPVFEFPAEWQGEAAKSSDGNPFHVDGAPRWRLDQIWPDNSIRSVNFRPLAWDGKLWHAPENSSGGQPSAHISKSKLHLSARSASAESPGDKLSAVAFIAPLKAAYTLNLVIHPDIFEGNRTMVLHVLRRSLAPDTAAVATFDLPDKTSTAIKDVKFPLDAGDELILLPAFKGAGQAGCNFTIESLKLTCAP